MYVAPLAKRGRIALPLVMFSEDYLFVFHPSFIEIFKLFENPERCDTKPTSFNSILTAKN